MIKSYQVITRTFSMLCCAVMFTTLVSCSGDDGETGPQGAQGEQGAKGDKGDTGAKGADAVAKSGYIDGTVTGTRVDNTPFTETFKYEYSDDVTILSNGSMNVDRSELPDDGSYVGIQADIQNFGTPQQTVTGTYFYLYFLKELSASSLFELSLEGIGNGSTLNITNYQYNATTGALTFSYAYTNDGTNYNTTGHPVTVTGTFNSGVGKVYSEVIYRKAN